MGRIGNIFCISISKLGLLIIVSNSIAIDNEQAIRTDIDKLNDKVFIYISKQKCSMRFDSNFIHHLSFSSFCFYSLSSYVFSQTS